MYWACITSYDYDAPISESGDTGQPGIGGPNKFDVRTPSLYCITASLKVHARLSQQPSIVGKIHRIC